MPYADRTVDHGAWIAQVFVSHLIPGVEARRNNYPFAARIENRKGHHWSILIPVHERAETAALGRLNLEVVEVAHRGLQSTIVDAVIRVIAGMRRDATKPGPPLGLWLGENGALPAGGGAAGRQ